MGFSLYVFSIGVMSNSSLNLKFQFDAGPNIPPPHYYQYSLQLKPTAEGLAVDYSVQYLHREDLTEEEIYGEGFTLNDDWSVQEVLPEVWQRALEQQLAQYPLNFRSGPDKELSSSLKVAQADKTAYSGEVGNQEAWTYFLQELIQAVLEVNGQEMPFQLEYLEVENKDIHRRIEVEASFAHRSVKVISQKANKPERSKTIEWNTLPRIMQHVFAPDYNYDTALSEMPKRSGTYINTGEGLWFEWGKSLTEPKGESTSLLRLKSMLKQLGAKEDE